MFAQTLSDACGADPGIVCRAIYNLTGTDSAGAIADWLTKPIKVLVILLVAWVLSKLAKRAIHGAIEGWIERRGEKEVTAQDGLEDDGLLAASRVRLLHDLERAERSRQRARTLSDVLESLASLVIFVIAGMISLSEFDVNLGPLIAGAGIVGVAVGFGAQSLVKDFLSGIFMIIEDQYGVGDVIDVGETTGVVEEVRLRTTQIRDLRGTLWFIPNGEIHRVANKSQAWARTVLDVEVAYDTDLDHAMSVIKRVADDLWRADLEQATILEEPEIWGVESFGASAIAIRLVLKVEPAEQWTTAREIRKRLKFAFDDEGIEIPFPQRTIWMYQGDRENETTDREGLPSFGARGAPEGEG